MRELLYFAVYNAHFWTKFLGKNKDEHYTQESVSKHGGALYTGAHYTWQNTVSQILIYDQEGITEIRFKLPNEITTTTTKNG